MRGLQQWAWVVGALSVVGASSHGAAQQRTMGSLLNTPSAFDGYTLFEALRWPETFLINNQGLLVHSWQHDYQVAAMSYLLDNGNLVRVSNPGVASPFQAGGAGGLVQEFDWAGVVQWEFLYCDDQVRQHHDLAWLPNGNALFIAWEWITATDAIAAGRNPAFLGESLWPDHVVEVEPTGASAVVVWEWHAWDHLIQEFDPARANHGVVSDHPELIDINYPATANPDWLHFNAIDYNADLDQIGISSPRFGEVWVIDHGTTTAEAAGHTGGAQGKGGDLLYRWGNPESYGRGGPEDKRLFFQHNTHWIPSGRPGAGNILVFNNGNGRPDGSYSSLEEIVTSVQADGSYPVPAPGQPHAPTEAIWTYVSDPPEDFFSSFISGAQRQVNGNTLACAGAGGRVVEMDPAGTVVWEYVNPMNSDGPQVQGNPPTGNSTFRAVRYPFDSPAMWGRDLTPQGPLELYSTGVASVVLPEPRFALAQNYPNPFRPVTDITFSLSEGAPVRLDVYDVSGRHVATLLDAFMQSGQHRQTWRAGRFASGVYLYSLRVGAERETRTMTLVN